MSRGFYSIDLGGSTIDIIRWKDSSYTHIQTIESAHLPEKDPRSWIDTHPIFSQVLEDKQLSITGGKSLLLPNEYIRKGKKIMLHSVAEFDAIAKGAAFLSNFSKGLAISMGTGTAMVRFENTVFEHVKGTGIGGGTLLGLAKAMIHPHICFEEIMQLAERGQQENINLSVGDIMGGGIGLLDANTTASNFAKYSIHSSAEDIAFGIVTLVSESIIALAIEKSLRLGNLPIIAGGKLAKIPFLQKKMKDAGDLFQIDIIFPEDSGIMTAIGAGAILSQN